MRYRARRADPIGAIFGATMVGIITLFALGGFIGVTWAVVFLLTHAYEGAVSWLLG